MGQKLGSPFLGRGLRPLFGQEELGPHLTQCRPGRGYFRIKWYIDPCSRLAAIDMG